MCYNVSVSGGFNNLHSHTRLTDISRALPRVAAGGPLVGIGSQTPQLVTLLQHQGHMGMAIAASHVLHFPPVYIVE